MPSPVANLPLKSPGLSAENELLLPDEEVAARRARLPAQMSLWSQDQSKGPAVTPGHSDGLHWTHMCGRNGTREANAPSCLCYTEPRCTHLSSIILRFLKIPGQNSAHKKALRYMFLMNSEDFTDNSLSDESTNFPQPFKTLPTARTAAWVPERQPLRSWASRVASCSQRPF